MSRGYSKSKSEAGTIARGDTAQSRIARATKLLNEGEFIGGPQGGGTVKQADGSFKSVSEETRAILAGERPSKERYRIDMSEVTGGRDSNKMLQVGKLNLIDGTIEGYPIAGQTGALDNIGSNSTKYYRTDYVQEKANRQPGFVFATDGKDVYALPHSWDVNNPAGTVGIYKGDVIVTNGKELNVIGSFDNTKRGLQSAAIAAGEALGRDRGVKQTAIVLSHQTGKQSGIDSVRSASYGSVFGSQTIQELLHKDGPRELFGISPA